MLGKMIIQGLVVAAVIGGAAAVYAQAKSDTGYLAALANAPAVNDAAPTAKATKSGGDNGYLPALGGFGKELDDDKAKHDGHKRHHDGHKRDHDDDDD